MRGPAATSARGASFASCGNSEVGRRGAAEDRILMRLRRHHRYSAARGLTGPRSSLRLSCRPSSRFSRSWTSPRPCLGLACMLALSIILPGAAVSGEADIRSVATPLRLANLNPSCLFFGVPNSAGARMMPQGSSELVSSKDIASHLRAGRSGSEQVLMDEEPNRQALGLRHELWEAVSSTCSASRRFHAAVACSTGSPRTGITPPACPWAIGIVRRVTGWRCTMRAPAGRMSTSTAASLPSGLRARGWTTPCRPRRWRTTAWRWQRP